MATTTIPFDSGQLLIGGRWRAAASGATLALENPSDGAELARIARGAAADVDAAVGAAQAALDGEWGSLTAAERGRKLFYDKGNCFDCHASDAMGNSDYGAPPLLGPKWSYGGDRLSLRNTIYSGRHGRCPAWISVLTPPQIRALAVYLYVESRAP